MGLSYPTTENKGLGISSPDENIADRTDAVDRAGISAIRGLKPLQPARQLILGVRRLTFCPEATEERTVRNLNLATVAVVSASGCIGPAALPQPTKENVTPADIVGTWRYGADYGKTAVTLEIKADGTFNQTVNRSNGKTHLHSGTWTLDGPYPKLKVLYPVWAEPTKDWHLEDANWRIVASHQQGVKFAIFGAAEPDPDSFEEFNKVR